MTVLQDLWSIRLDSVDFVSPVLLCALTVKFGITLVLSIARVLPSLQVLPADVRRQVLKLLCPHLNEDESETLFTCVARLPNLPDSIFSMTQMSFTCSRHHVVNVRAVTRIWWGTTVP